MAGRNAGVLEVTLAGWAATIGLIVLLFALDLFVSASRTESFGLAIVEAMASGLAVVATATEGARESVEDGASGLLVPVGDVEALAHGIARLLEDTHARDALGRRARRLAHERFSLEHMVSATEQVYKEALASMRG